jgi:hypothetical protein
VREALAGRPLHPGTAGNSPAGSLASSPGCVSGHAARCCTSGGGLHLAHVHDRDNNPLLVNLPATLYLDCLACCCLQHPFFTAWWAPVKKNDTSSCAKSAWLMRVCFVWSYRVPVKTCLGLVSRASCSPAAWWTGLHAQQHCSQSQLSGQSSWECRCGLVFVSTVHL